MIVGPPLPPRALPTPGSGTPRLLAGDEAPGLAFAELLTGAGPLPARDSAEFGFTSNGRDFRGTVHVGEDAIRFDARPVVAPTNLGAGKTLAGPQSDTASEMPAVNLPPAPRLGMPGPPSDALASALNPAAGAAGGPNPVLGRAAAPRGSAGPERLGQVVAAPPASTTGQNAARIAAAPGAGAVGHATRAGMTAAQARPPVSAIVTPQDVLVVLHGIALSTGEQKTLLQDVRDLLAAHGLGDRAIRLRTDSRRTR